MFLDDEGESQWPEIRFSLMWREHGGSGLGMAWETVNNLDIEDVEQLYERANEQRRKEVEQMRKASKRTPQ